jgi:hypothetical protein
MTMGLRSFIHDVRKLIHRFSLKATPPFVIAANSVTVTSEQAQNTQTGTHEPQPPKLVQGSPALSVGSELLNYPEHSLQPLTTLPHFSEAPHVGFTILLAIS